ncbi:MAG: Rossmann-like domain-containing protein [Candidatus Muiribacteriota bacterium]
MNFLRKISKNIKSDLIVEDIITCYSAVFVRTSLKYGYCHIVPLLKQNNILHKNLPFPGDFIGKKVCDVLKVFTEISHPLYNALSVALIDSVSFSDKKVYGKLPAEILSFLKNKKIVLIGRFKFYESLKEKGFDVNVVELNPLEGETAWHNSESLLKKADITIITGFTLVNETIDQVLIRGRNSCKILLGGSVPELDKILDMGIDYIGSTEFMNYNKVIQFYQKGALGIKSLSSDLKKPYFISS